MGYLTTIFIVLAFITILNCAPIDEYTANPPSVVGAAFSTSTTTVVPSSSTTYQHIASKRQTAKDDSSDSRESRESSEENNKRPTRDTDNSGVVAHQAKQDSSTLGAIQTPPPVTKDTPTQQLPARERRGVYYDDILPGAHAVTSQSTTASSTTSTTASSATSSTTNQPN